MINAILSGIFSLIIGLVNLILSPIDAIIEKALPSVADGLDMVANFFSWVSGLIPWGISWFGFNATVIGLFVAYITFELTVPLTVHTIKLAIKWYNQLKP